MSHADGLYYERHGAGEPLLLVTGWTISAAVFEPVLDRYSEHFECIVYDHRGSARSKGVGPSTMGALADDAARLLTSLRIPRALVYGLSMGGMVAQEVALRHPGRVRGLVLGGTSSGGAFAPRVGPRELISIARGGFSERSLRAPVLFSPEFRREHPERVRELIHQFKLNRSSAATIGAQTVAAARFASTLRLGRVRAPTLVMHGERDQLVPLAAGRMLASRIPDAELAIVPGAGHAYALEAPQESLDLLLDWYERKLSRTRPREEAHVAPDR
jgi:pimeloyl-ACP methyl ester carboxylesterase